MCHPPHGPWTDFACQTGSKSSILRQIGGSIRVRVTRIRQKSMSLRSSAIIGLRRGSNRRSLRGFASLFRLSGIAEDLFTNDSFGRFI